MPPTVSVTVSHTAPIQQSALVVQASVPLAHGGCLGAAAMGGDGGKGGTAGGEMRGGGEGEGGGLGCGGGGAFTRSRGGGGGGLSTAPTDSVSPPAKAIPMRSPTSPLVGKKRKASTGSPKRIRHKQYWRNLVLSYHAAPRLRLRGSCNADSASFTTMTVPLATTVWSVTRASALVGIGRCAPRSWRPCHAAKVSSMESVAPFMGACNNR